MTLQASITAMHDDAKDWQGISDALAGASTAVAGFGLTEAQMSWAAAETSLLSTYAALCAETIRRIDEGKNHLHLVAVTLNQCADAYQRSDAEATTLFGGAWDPRR